MNQIALYDKAWDSILKLPRNIQKRVPEFLEKFRTNSRDPSLHLEPISTFADQQLRTARVNKQYRAIIHVPTSGNLYHLLYIDNHDEAMAWAERKLFEWNDFTHSYQVFTKPAEELIDLPPAVPSAGPTIVPEARAYDHLTDEQLLAIGVPSILLPSVREVSTLDQLEELYDYLPIEALENLSMLLEGSTYDSIIREVEEGKVASDDRAAQEASPNNQRSFFEVTDDELLNRMLEGEVAKWRIFLHPSQQRLVEGSFKGPTKVTGGAGTGKTVAALHRAKVLQQRGAASREQPIFFTTYTRSLKDNLREELDSLGVDPTLVILDNLDHYVVNAARKVNLLPPEFKILNMPGSKKSSELWEEVIGFKLTSYEPTFLDNEYQDVILFQGIQNKETYFQASRRGRQKAISRKDKVGIWKLVEEYRSAKQEQGYIDLFEVYNLLSTYYDQQPVKPFRHVIADELQDFSNIHLRLLRSLVAEQPDDLFLVGDPLQQIYGRRIIFSEAGINVRGRRSRRLKINYRTTEQIKQAAIGVISDVDFSDFEEGKEDKSGYVSLRVGRAPSYVVHKTQKGEMEDLVRELQGYLHPTDGSEAVLPCDICIATRRRDPAKAYRSAVHKAGIPYYDHIERSRPTGDSKGVWISTFHNLKGLEFKVVFLVDVSAGTFPFRPQAYQAFTSNERKAHDEGEKSLMYVAMTRAISRVHISGVGTGSEVLSGMSSEG